MSSVTHADSTRKRPKAGTLRVEPAQLAQAQLFPANTQQTLRKGKNVSSLLLTRTPNLRSSLSVRGRAQEVCVSLHSLVSRTYVRAKEKTPCILVGPLVPRDQGSRGGAALRFASVVALDLDDGSHVNEVLSTLRDAGVSHVAWETASSTAVAPRWRIVVPLASPLNPALYPHVYKALSLLLSPARPAFDYACARPLQKAVLPTRTRDQRAPELREYENEPLDIQSRWFAPQLQEQLQYAHSVGSLGRARVPRDEQPPVIRAFNEVYEDLADLADPYGAFMGCTYRPEGPQSWTWVGADGTVATPGGVVASDRVAGAVVDFYGSSPLGGRVVFPFDILLAQARLHAGAPLAEAMPDDPTTFKRVSADLLDVVRADPKVQRRQAEISREFLTEPAPVEAAQKLGQAQREAFQATKAQLEEAGRALEAAEEPPGYLATLLIRSVGKKSRESATDAEACLIARHSVTLQNVVRHRRTGAFIWTPPSGERQILDDDATDALFEQVLAECGPIVTISKARRRTILNLTTRGARVIDPFSSFLEKAAEDWRKNPTVRLTSAEGGIHPGAEDNYLNRLYFASFVRSIAARNLYPGVRWDHMFILQGDQARGKTSLLRALSGETLLDGENLFNEFDPRSLLANEGNVHSLYTRLSGGSLAVTDEMAALESEEASAALKSFLTRTAWSAVGKYQVLPTHQKVGFAIAGTSNAARFLPADGGIRRYLVYPMLPTSDPQVLDLVATHSPLAYSLLGEATAWVQDVVEQARREVQEASPELASDAVEARAVEALGWALGAPFLPEGEAFDAHVQRASRFAALPEVEEALIACASFGIPSGDWVAVEMQELNSALERVGLRLSAPRVRAAIQFYVERLGGRQASRRTLLPVGLLDEAEVC